MMIETVIGPMFSGKTEYLLSQAAKLRAVGYEVVAFKSIIDTRSPNALTSRIGTSFPAVMVTRWEDIYRLTVMGNYRKQVILIDEIQFMPEQSMDGRTAGRFVWDMKQSIQHEFHIKIICSGLLYTTEQKPFHTTQSILTVTDKITHCTALCKLCESTAAFTICTERKTTDVVVGDSEKYEPRCGNCYSIGNPNWIPTKFGDLA
jgi:thymidine kinase